MTTETQNDVFADEDLFGDVAITGKIFEHTIVRFLAEQASFNDDKTGQPAMQITMYTMSGGKESGPSPWDIFYTGSPVVGEDGKQRMNPFSKLGQLVLAFKKIGLPLHFVQSTGDFWKDMAENATASYAGRVVRLEDKENYTPVNHKGEKGNSTVKSIKLPIEVVRQLSETELQEAKKTVLAWIKAGKPKG